MLGVRLSRGCGAMMQRLRANAAPTTLKLSEGCTISMATPLWHSISSESQYGCKPTFFPDSVSRTKSHSIGYCSSRASPISVGVLVKSARPVLTREQLTIPREGVSSSFASPAIHLVSDSSSMWCSNSCHLQSMNCVVLHDPWAIKGTLECSLLLNLRKLQGCLSRPS